MSEVLIKSVSCIWHEYAANPTLGRTDNKNGTQGYWVGGCGYSNI